MTIIKILYKHRDLIIQLTKRELQMRHKGSRLGSLWALLSPCMMLSLYLFIFGFVFKGKFGILPQETFFDFALALFLGLSVFNLVSETISIAPSLIISQPNYVKKVVFPLEIIPISKVIASLYYTLISVLICLLLTPLSSSTLSFNILYMPLLIIPLIMICLGISWGIASLSVFYRDINHITSFTSTALMYASAIVYAPSRIPNQLAILKNYNPILLIINEFRNITLWNIQVNFRNIISIYILSFFIFWGGFYLFRFLRPHFAEVI